MPKPKKSPAAVAPTFEVGTVFAAPVLDGRWTAYQVGSIEDGRPSLVALDWLDVAPPTLEQARAAGVLRVTHHAWKGEPHHVFVGAEPPPRTWRMLGVLPVPALAPCKAYGGWPSSFAQVVLERRWLEEIPEAIRAAFKAAQDSRPLRVSLGSFEVEWPASTNEGELGSRSAALQEDDLLEWSALDKFARLSQLEVHGAPAGLVEHLASRPLISTLQLDNVRVPVLDLSRTYLSKLSIEIAAPMRLVLPARLVELNVSGDGDVVVEHGSGGAQLSLMVFSRRSGPLPDGLPALRALRVWHAGAVDLGAVARAYPALVSLTIGGTSTALEAVERLADLRELRDLELNNCYRLDASALPTASTWPTLETVSIAGHRKEDAALLRARLGGAPSFELLGGKTDAWLAANLDNPFRDWIDRNPRTGKLAAAAWRKTRAALPTPPAGSKTETLLRAFIQTFNDLGDKHPIDTVDREEIAEAFRALTVTAGVSDETSDRWFSAWCKF